MVSVPYEITLLSNSIVSMFVAFLVSVPYEITLLSNIIVSDYVYTAVSVPYEITLLSNSRLATTSAGWFQYLMKLHYSQTYVHSNNF